MNTQQLNDILKVKQPESSNLFNEFQRIAEHLFNDFTISVGSQQCYRFTELEFYYQTKDHFDPYVHAKPEQKTICDWYSHASGIDLTFGNNNAYGGILIRGLYDIVSQVHINGLFKIRDLISNKQLGKIEIVENSNEIDKILYSTRVGLTKKETDDKDYFSRNYRFITHICVNNKFREKEKVIKIAYDSKLLDKDGIRKYFGYLPKIFN